MVILAEQQTVARNPGLVTLPSELNLTVMVVAVTGPGVEVPENVWVVEPAITSTLSQQDSVLNAAKVTVTGSPAVDSILHVYNNMRHEGNMETSGLPLHNYWDSHPGS